MSDSITKAVIVAGGKGTRLATFTNNTAKALVEIGGKPIIQHQIELLRGQGVKEIWLLLGHLGEQIQHFAEQKDWGVVLHFLHEKQPLGTAGALKQLEGEIQEDFFALSGDVMINIDLQRFVDWHTQKEGIASLMVHPNDHPFDSDLVEADGKGRVLSLLRRPHAEDLVFRTLSIASLYIFSPRIFPYIPKGEKSDMEKDVLPKLLQANENIYAYNTPEYIKDMGTPNRLEEVRKDYESGKIFRMSLKNERRAIFLDRDGVLNEEVDQLAKIEDFRLYDFTPEAVKKINESDFMAIVVSNQPMVAKGFMTEKDVQEMQKELETELGKKGAKIDAAYYCFHHPEKGFEGERPELKIECACRKPKPGLLLEAQKDFHIDLKRSYMIGDQTVDILAGRNAGCKTVLVQTGYAGKDARCEAEPDGRAQDVLDAVNNIMLAQAAV
ncbi:MAG: hypothetical protein A3J30_03065 [Candidatus Wildermuthbacteria bacterium RIFCSPLOWO2_02_FULL_47_9c]|uniref:D,D-heptose 1,7-bisphosphate phosphatase n=2 Tax=Parcubacteria group TaxID=1794811 RepID=A0A837IKK0_9BACT|nr:MAG: hypothetical protein UY25_C0005G0064 [Candidatus Yanofskybacteria bacterium GW2011_GWC1_48_11]KKW04086.1 MAG: hypothetical protein UY38_C0002G0240 [Parcubacteria group bacterium GW2011_GWB1_49_12]KKW08812.1 MAG: hypothetical protein UY45_C0003G0019 [Parcubacteria group bacterium GW2011_GWA1_49_26]KKW14291.1 MAG: hypothetical protein UY53_C0001G0007 [Parcubacteria group bacterium GW2011_GWA2_50_10]OHA61739.1 MAG: hypothetical protein A2109_00105 [Candidatus Wildermuthbacteria bacterium G